MRRRWVAGLAALIGVALGVTVSRPLPARLAEAPSTVVAWRDGTPAHVFLAPDDRWRVLATPADVDPDYVAALLAIEDRRFRLHPGVDPAAIVRAALTNLARGRVVSGASTLTMQLVRVLEPRPRTLGSKVIEVWRASTLELRLSKDAILSAYLTFAPYGGNLEGVHAASLALFGHPADALSPAEIATLLAIPQSPNRRRADPVALAAARDDLAARLADEGLLAPGEPAERQRAVLAQVRGTPVPTTLQAFPREVPHLAIWLRSRRPGEVRLVTTLDRSAQRVVDEVLNTARALRSARDVHNGSVVVLDRDEATVLALAGNLDFADAGHGGQIAAFDVPRSPGSTLKPLLYAMAIDRGLALPERLVADLPRQYAGYVPENYDGSFRGVVTLEEALSRSLNLPFIDLLGEVGVDAFLATLRSLGITHLDDRPGFYGLSAIVGGIELTPLELAGVTLTLAEEGRYRPIRLLTDTPETPARPVVAPGAVWLTARALRLRDRPDFPQRREVSAVPRDVAWKTGTSFGHRDAWSVGWDAEHAAVVWLGNLDQRSSAALVGSEAAGPVLFDVLEGLRDAARRPPDPPPRPDDLIPVDVCALSGHLPGPACPRVETAWALEAHVPTAPCPYHLSREVDQETGLAVNPSCRAGRSTETRSFVRWPAAVRRWLSDSRRDLPGVPSWAPGCTPSVPAGPPLIVSPPEGRVAVLVAGMAADDQEIPLEADAEEGGTLAWFVDGIYLGRAASRERLWWTPSPGMHEVVVVDDAGRSAKRTLEVRGQRDR